MSNVRTLNKDKYKISEYRFRELYYFCLQYSEWKEELKEKRNPLKAVQFNSMPSSGSPGHPTEKVGIECAELSQKCTFIENAAKMADSELKDFILYAVTTPGVTFSKLKANKQMPCERDRYYNSRRKFYFVLDKILRNKDVSV